MSEATREELIVSFYRVRQALGYMGFFLPLALIFGGVASLGEVEPSISDYYHTVLRDVFVGTMCAIGIFLIAYPGHRRGEGERFSDDMVTSIAGIAAFGVAFFPNEGPAGVSTINALTQMALGHELAAKGHYLSAVIFLGCLGYICLVKFARTAKPVRRWIYRTSGITIYVMTVLVIVASVIKILGPAGPQEIVVNFQLVLWFEAVAVWAFSVSWLTKGRAEQSILSMFTRGKRGDVTGEAAAEAASGEDGEFPTLSPQS